MNDSWNTHKHTQRKRGRKREKEKEKKKKTQKKKKTIFNKAHCLYLLYSELTVEQKFHNRRKKDERKGESVEKNENVRKCAKNERDDWFIKKKKGDKEFFFSKEWDRREKLNQRVVSGYDVGTLW